MLLFPLNVQKMLLKATLYKCATQQCLIVPLQLSTKELF